MSNYTGEQDTDITVEELIERKEAITKKNKVGEGVLPSGIEATEETVRESSIKEKDKEIEEIQKDKQIEQKRGLSI